MRRTDHHVHIEPLADMPGDMAVKRPDTWIVRNVFNDKISGRLQQLYVPSLHVPRVNRSIPGTRTLGNDVKIVTVEMHGVHHWTLVVEHDTDRVILADIVHVPLGVVRVGSVALVGEVEERHTAVV